MARVGETVFLAINSMMTRSADRAGARAQARASPAPTPWRRATGGRSSTRTNPFRQRRRLIAPSVLSGSSPATAACMSLGKLCERGPAAEIWDKDGKPKIVDLGPWWKDMGYRPAILKGDGDELWACSGA